MANHYDNQPSKRIKTDNFGGGRGPGGAYDDQHKVSPSPVVHVRGLSDRAMERDIVDAVQHFGSVDHVVVMPRKRQALVQFQDITGAHNCVSYADNGQIFIAGQPAFFNFSTSQHLERSHPSGEMEKKQPNCVLLFTIANPAYPITTDVLHKICSPIGEVLRIVVFKKNGVHAMVEFDSAETATRAMEQLNGADIYSGCCTLKIEYAKPPRLNVFKNDNESWDYTQPNLGKFGGQEPAQRRAPLLQEPPGGGYPGNDQMSRRGPGGFDDGYSGGYGQQGGGRGPNMQYGGPQGPDRYRGPPGGDRFGGQGPMDSYGPGPQGPGDRYSMGGSQGGPPGQQGSVMMVYGLNPDKVNCDSLFNVSCLYGNVSKVKFLKSKAGVAMIQMSDAAAAERVIHHLNNTYFFDSKMQMGPSKQAFLNEVMNPYTLPDGELSYKDYSGSRNNRFSTPEQANKNRIQSPSKVVHFYNVPYGIKKDEVREMFEGFGAPPPSKVLVFPAKSEKSASGLAEWDRPEGAFEAVCICNHKQIPNPTGKFPYTLKLCFSIVPRGQILEEV